MTTGGNETAPVSAQEAFDRALELHDAEPSTEAERLYRIALAFEPTHAGALCYLGLLELNHGQAAEGARLLRLAIASDPELAEAHSHLGTALLAMAQYEEALEAHEKALALAPDYEDARYGLGLALQGLGRDAEAIDCHEKVLVADPGHDRAHFALGVALAAVGRDREAFAHWRNASELDGSHAGKMPELLAAYARKNPARAQAGMQRLNHYIGTFLTNHAQPRMGEYPGLTSSPFHEGSGFPGVQALETNYAAIREEIDALAAGEFHAEAENLMERGAWDVFLFHERGRRNAENCARCPTISRIIDCHDTVRTIAGLLYVSKLAPGTHIRPHRGPTNVRLRCHLGIRIPEGDCGLRVGGEQRSWREGKCLVFDDSLEHEAWNYTAEPRIVLIIDFWHPDLSPAEIAFLEGMHRFAMYQAGSLHRYWSANAASRVRSRKGYD